MRLHKVAYFAATAALCATVSSAQDRAQRFEERDANGDGVLSQGEYTSTGGHPGNFRALDVNADGVLSREEFVARTGAVEPPAVVDPYSSGADLRGTGVGRGTRESAAGPEFAKLDTNRDRLLSLSEWYGEPGVFRRMDTDNDGVVTTAEYAAYENANGGPYGGYNNDGRMTKDPNGAYTRDVGRFEDYDRNRDGLLSRYEWTGDRATFDRMDRNQDGVIAYREFDAPMVGDSRSGRFRDLDRNADGVISRAEWTSDRQSFSLLDRNRDGRLTSYEFQDTRSLQDRFDQLDRNRNGVVERGEWIGSFQSFRAMDRNRDGRLSRDEYVL